MTQWLFLAIAILAEVFATSMLKLSNGFTRIIPSSCSIIGYIVSFYCLAQTLKHMPVGITRRRGLMGKRDGGGPS